MFGKRQRLLVCALLLGVGCHTRQGDDKSSAAPKSNQLPTLSVKADTPNLLLTWIDDKGDFHVVEKPADVPAESRKDVRVVATDKESGTGDQVYVANLDETAPDGSYKLKTLSRAAWDELGASRRKTRLEAMAPPSAAPSPAGPGSAEPARTAGKAAGAVLAIIYGASWCKPCHDAEAYLRQHGANVIKKDIEENEAAASEMKQKLSRAGMGGASIPVIDIMGRIMVGFSPPALDRALDAARGVKTL
ncbi:MAG: glutaredoxin domain-containing protein [Polyangiaceae bacterium]